MKATEGSWLSLVLRPKSGYKIRAAIEDLLYTSGCVGIWDHLPDGGIDGCGSEAWLDTDNNDPFEAADGVLLTAYFPAEVRPRLAELALRLTALDLVVEEPQLETVANEDWLENWRRNFSITELTDDTLVVPTWEELPAAETRLGLRIYPGQGFGTGTHETTRLAAFFIERELKRAHKPVSFLDVGSGSGILAILAAKRGAEPILALDLDPQALINARENCGHNLVSEKIVLADTPVTLIREKFQLIAANIIAPVLHKLAPELSRLLKPGGRLILSGILIEQLPELLNVYAELGLMVEERKTSGEWTACIFQAG